MDDTGKLVIIVMLAISCFVVSSIYKTDGVRMLNEISHTLPH